ncbi:Hormonally up-regulated neu tumor-associated kinase [Dissostichus eleginoides]|uniref:Hormonally up-regulated neu tumor-associated kinase n=1 Tax=Dissostichus eleginoides TaxID=100907 RepID=A0AAD9BXP4_DISEL|nr:Hormonally up-regulated neu tumor-associated kinase [Dissostichus eleginoides]
MSEMPAAAFDLFIARDRAGGGGGGQENVRRQGHFREGLCLSTLTSEQPERQRDVSMLSEWIYVLLLRVF